MTQPWNDWTDPQVRTQFSSGQATQNAHYLDMVLGADWISAGVAGSSDHLLHMDWRAGGLDAFMRLNVLAEDLRALESVPGLIEALHDLRQVAGFEPTRHMLHMAAMMQRGGARVTQLFPPSNETIPDFEIDVAGTRLTIEAKQLTESGPSRTFRQMAPTLMQDLIATVCVPGQNYPVLTVVIKDSDVMPERTALIAAVTRALDDAGAVPLQIFTVSILSARARRRRIVAFSGSPNSPTASCAIIIRPGRLACWSWV